MQSMFPEGFDPAMMKLLEVLNGSESSYTINLFRYEGYKEYTAEVIVRDFKVNLSNNAQDGVQIQYGMQVL